MEASEQTRRKYISWKPQLERLRNLYDNPKPKSRIIRKLWRCAVKVRNSVSGLGRDQILMSQNAQSLSVSGLIYAIYSFRTRRLYVGQTLKTAMFRFQEHVRKSLRGEGESLHKAMRNLGWENFAVFSLEKFSAECMRETRARLGLAHSVLLPLLEKGFWIDYLHSYLPSGFNIHLSRHRLHRTNNPMRRCRTLVDSSLETCLPSVNQTHMEESPHSTDEVSDHSLRWTDLETGIAAAFT